MSLKAAVQFTSEKTSIPFKGLGEKCSQRTVNPVVPHRMQLALSTLHEGGGRNKEGGKICQLVKATFKSAKYNIVQKNILNVCEP